MSTLPASPLDWRQYLDQFSALLLKTQRTETEVPGLLSSLVLQPGFAVYRNTFLKACVDALEGNYPAVSRLVGEEWFRGAATRFALASPPVAPMLFGYGDGFAAFLDNFEPARELPYLADVARLDRAWTESHLAIDAAPLTLTGLAALAPHQLVDLRLAVHPAARWQWFPDQPIYSIWSANRDEVEMNEQPEWHGEGVVITRPEGEVTWREVPRAACLLLDACAAGIPLEEAAQLALSEVPPAEQGQKLSALLAELINAGAFLDIAAEDAA
jgi:GNAT superfamily N-acetyltransferase